MSRVAPTELVATSWPGFQRPRCRPVGIVVLVGLLLVHR